jgi:hypothetical protein
MELQGHDYNFLFVSTSKGETRGSSDRAPIPSSAREGDARCLSRSPTLSRKDKQPMEDIDECIENRVAKYFGNTVFFGSVVERSLGAVFAK